MFYEAGDAAKTRNTGRRSQKGNLNEIQGKRDIFLFFLIHIAFIIDGGGMGGGGLCTLFLRLHGLKSSRNSSRLKNRRCELSLSIAVTSAYQRDRCAV